MTSLLGIRVPWTRTVSPVNTTSSCACDSEMSVTTGLVASLANPFPFVRTSCLRFGYRHVRCSSASSLGVGAGVVLGADEGATSGDGECCREGGVGERRLGGEVVGWPLMSTSHVNIVSSSSRRLLSLVAGAGSVLRVRGE